MATQPKNHYDEGETVGFIFEADEYCPACALRAMGGRIMPQDHQDPGAAMARIATRQGKEYPEGDSCSFPQPVKRDQLESEHSSCGVAAIETGDYAACLRRCRTCNYIIGGECPPMEDYRQKAREMYAHTAGFRWGFWFGVDSDTADIAGITEGDEEIPEDGFDARFADTWAEFDAGFREGLDYCLRCHREISEAGTDARPTAALDDTGLMYAACEHRDDWEHIAASESFAIEFGYGAANDNTPEEN